MKAHFVLFVLSLLWSYVVSETCTTPLGATSVCVPLTECKQFLFAINQKPIKNEVVTFLKNSQCSFKTKIPTVCCGPLPTQQLTNTVDPVSPEDSYPAPQNACGEDTGGDRIFGGQFTDLDEFPWMVLQGYLTKDNKMSYQCGGVLLNHRYELTAAHCVVGEIEIAVGKLKTVRLGEYDIQRDIDCIDGQCADPYQEIPVLSAHPHPGFVDGTINREDDIALVRLAKRAKYTFFVKPICVLDNSLRLSEGFYVYVAGWGKTLTGKRSPVKLKLGLPIFNKAECFKMYKKGGVELTNKQICAGGTFAEDACRGDSGGPLMRKRPNGVWETVGVVSFGYGCGRDGWPGVYSSVESYLDWINNTMRVTNV